MADDDVGAADIQQHGGADLAGIGALLFPVQILRADGYVRTLAALNRHAKIYVGWADDDFVPRVAGNQGQEVMKKCLRLLRVLVHLPVGGHQLLSHESLSGNLGAERLVRGAARCIGPDTEFYVYFLSVSASTPGSFLPSRNSSEAPPPVEMCVILSATPAAFTADTESPPPTIEIAPTFSAMAWAIL